MSALPQTGPQMRDLFAKDGRGLMGAGTFDYTQKESRSSYEINSKKKRRAPAPPSGLGQYKPKILSHDSVVDVPIERDEVEDGTPVPPPRLSKGRHSGDNDNHHHDDGSSLTKPLIMGDKNVPMVLPTSRDGRDLELDVSDLRLAPENQELGTDNPLFQMHDEEEEKEVVVLQNGNSHTQDDDHAEAEEKGEPEGVYIPAPDYDEEEKTMMFPDEPEDDEDATSPQRGKKVYKEYYGEDFAQYLSDEEVGLDEMLRRPKRSSHLLDRKSKTEVKRPHYKKRESLPVKNKKGKGISGSNSLRDFSFADSKFGTVNGSKKRHSLPSMSEDTEEAELFVNTGSSYEQFLRSRNGEELPEVFSDHALGEERAGFPGAPPRYARPAHNKDTLWKKLTWKFKKQVRNSFDLSTS